MIIAGAQYQPSRTGVQLAVARGLALAQVLEPHPERERTGRLDLPVAREIAVEIDADVEAFVLIDHAESEVDGAAVLAQVAPGARDGGPIFGKPGPARDHASGLLDFALSDAAQPIIAETGFVGRGTESQGIEVQGARLANSLTSPEEFSLPLFREMLGELKDAGRLSITFRFTPGSTTLETRSQSEAERFARLLAGGAYAGKDILLVGFTDSVGEFNVNRALAVRRAQSVLDTLKASVAEGALDAVPVLVQSYGELTPVGCNETPQGRELNRRVEVWVRDKRG